MRGPQAVEKMKAKLFHQNSTLSFQETKLLAINQFKNINIILGLTALF
jgi:hypothetical protein